jgi:hypothetical protein
MVARMKTTVEISDPLLEEAKRTAARDRTTVRALIEQGLRMALEGRSRKGRFRLRDASVRGSGLQHSVKGASWDRVRELAYEGRGA